MTPTGPNPAPQPETRSELRSTFTRRRFLRGAAAGGLAAWLASCSSDGTTSSSSDPPTTTTGSPAPGGADRGASFTQPELLASTGGLLEVVLRVEEAQIPWGDSTRYCLTYNGTTPGPTLRVRPGDRLQIRLENRLDESTNLHTHGLHVSPEGDGDNVFVAVGPGEDRTYVYDIPTDHRSGLFWYHPHAHGTVARQVAGGLAGAIVVLDDVDKVPELVDSNERIWILADPPIGTSRGILDTNAMDQMVGREGDVVLVNGALAPEVPARVGELERWRIVNASASRYYRLAVDDHELNVIATDGGRLPAPATATEVLLAPGERTELLVAASAGGRFAVRSLAYDRGGMGGMSMGGTSDTADEMTIATMVVTGAGEPAPLPEALPVTDDPLPDATASRVIELGMGHMMGRGDMVWTIDGRPFDPERTDVDVAPDVVEEWEIRNPTGMDHPFHLHVWPFRLVDAADASGWKDTVNVPAGGSVRLVVPFTGITGRTVYHCHILDHEDLGMMGVIDTGPGR